MITLKVSKAEPTCKEIETSAIIISEDLIKNKDRSEVFQDEANKIVDLLTGTLPGGTLDQILCRLLKDAACRLTVCKK